LIGSEQPPLVTTGERSAEAGDASGASICHAVAVCTRDLFVFCSRAMHDDARC
jgi:hypothetical protein